jgi:hypothetical protein
MDMGTSCADYTRWVEPAGGVYLVKTDCPSGQTCYPTLAATTKSFVSCQAIETPNAKDRLANEHCSFSAECWSNATINLVTSCVEQA